MMCHYPDLSSASDWLCHKDNVSQPIRSHTQIWLVTCHQSSFCGKPMIASGKVSCFKGLAKASLTKIYNNIKRTNASSLAY